MSTLSNPEILPAVKPPPVEKPTYLPPKESPLLNRFFVILMFFTFLVIAIAFTPQVAQQIAYSWNIGIERAKSDVARKFLADNPVAVTEQRTAWVAKTVTPCVVGIHTMVAKPLEENSSMYDRRNSIGFDLGSGVIVDEQGHILTNEHVIADAIEIRIQLSDGRVFSAEVVGQDSTVDIAVLRIEANNLQSVEWGDSRQVVVGEHVLAIGSPFGLQQTVTSGIISATEQYEAIRVLRGFRNGRASFPHAFLQTDAVINPGNSGGALVDMNGKVIGICTKYISEGGGNSGIGLAIPSVMAKYIYKEIISAGEVKRGWVGVDVEDLLWYDAQQIGQDRLRGTIITRIPRGTPAREAGLQRWDVILRWGETDIISALHLIHLVTLAEPGTKKTVEVFRRGEILTLEITVGVRPTNW